MDNGWIKLHRSITEWQWYKDIPCRVLFEHLILTANHSDATWKNLPIKRGQKITSLENLAIETGLSVQRVRSAIKKLKSTCEITCESTNRFTLITVINYELYQGEQHTKQQTNNKQITNKQQTNNNKQEEEECKNEKNDKNKLTSDDVNSAGAVYGNEEINRMLTNLLKVTQRTNFRESIKDQRYCARHLTLLRDKLGVEEFKARLKLLLTDEFKTKNFGSIKYIYKELKACPQQIHLNPTI